MVSRILIDGDACPVINSIIKMTQDTGIFVIIIRSFSHFSTAAFPNHVQTYYVDDGPDAVDYKVLMLSQPDDIVITQDYGLASLALNKARAVIHHNGTLYSSTTIDHLLAQRHHAAHLRKSNKRTKGSPPITENDILKFEERFQKLLTMLNLEE
ncbi:YaiI/YqxD family protein [Staphylococcus sp. SQ8-PEA]|uniref:UPF0178 protein N9R04_03460 n=1 Tax=Staphylococcus marylandisciuri TaxID=2981529 RepID=A0ABT2QP86_9STAP|nr:YaiI/YqxD family protein [Staphylococcus marylandisciuri]MCU5745779.1 YaiI/YqxD family protein [Staphylococcus marylandisciuri]